MKLLKLEIENFKNINEPIVYDFNNGNSFNISGANGTGKTTLMDAYTWCFSGKLSNNSIKGYEPKDNDINSINFGREKKGIKTRVKATFEIDNTKYVLERITPPTTIIFGKEGLEKRYTTVKDAVENIQTVLKLNDINHFVLLTNPAIIWNGTDNEIKQMTLKTLSDNKEIQNSIKKDFKEDFNVFSVVNEIKTLKTALNNSKKEIDNIQFYIKQNTNLNNPKQQKQTEIQIETLQNRIEQIKKENQKYNEELNTFESQLLTNSKLEEQNNNQLNKLKNQIVDIQKQEQSLVDKKNQLIDDYDLLPKTVETKIENELKQNSENKTKEIENIKKTISELEKKLEKPDVCKECGQEINVTIKLKDAQKKLELLSNDKIDEKVSKELYANILKELQEKNTEEIKHTDVELSKIRNSGQKLITEYNEFKTNFNKNLLSVETVTKINQKINDIKKEIETNTNSLTDCNQTIAKEKLRLEQFNTYLNENKHLKELEEKVTTLNEDILEKQSIIESYLNIIKDFLDTRLKKYDLEIVLFEYNKTNDTINETFIVRELKNGASYNTMNTGHKIRAGFRLIELLQENKEKLPIWIDEASVLDDETEFLLDEDRQTVFLRAKQKPRELTRDKFLEKAGKVELNQTEEIDEKLKAIFDLPTNTKKNSKTKKETKSKKEVETKIEEKEIEDKEVENIKNKQQEFLNNLNQEKSEVKETKTKKEKVKKEQTLINNMFDI